jgi:hypothetical protein
VRCYCMLLLYCRACAAVPRIAMVVRSLHASNLQPCKRVRCNLSISESYSKSHSLNHYLESQKLLSVFFRFPIVFLYLVHGLVSHSRFLFLGSEKSRIEDGYIWITKKLLESSFFFIKISISSI